MTIYVYSAGQDFYIKMAVFCCISHKRVNPDDKVVFLTTDSSLKETYLTCLSQEDIGVALFPEIKQELASIASDGDLTRFHTFARWACYLKAVERYADEHEIHALLDPDIVSLERWSDLRSYVQPGQIAFTRQFGWDNFINGGFIAGSVKDMKKVGAFLIDRVFLDISDGAYVRSPYDQVYWNRYFRTMGVTELCLGSDFIRLAFTRDEYKARLVHQIDYKGFIFRYPIMNQISQDNNIPIKQEDYYRY